VHLIAKPSVALASLEPFLGGFEPRLGFAGYLDDPVALTEPAQLCKLAGQLCYMSFGRSARTMPTPLVTSRT